MNPEMSNLLFTQLIFWFLVSGQLPLRKIAPWLGLEFGLELVLDLGEDA